MDVHALEEVRDLEVALGEAHMVDLVGDEPRIRIEVGRPKGFPRGRVEDVLLRTVQPPDIDDHGQHVSIAR